MKIIAMGEGGREGGRRERKNNGEEGREEKPEEKKSLASILRLGLQVQASGVGAFLPAVNFYDRLNSCIDRLTLRAI